MRGNNHKVMLVALTCLSLTISACRRSADRPADNELQIVCSFLPVYVIAQNVVQGIPGVKLHCLLPPQVGCPHHYSLTPNDAAALEKADVLILNGLGMEAFLHDSPFLKRSDLRVIEIGNAATPLKASLAADHHHAEHADHHNTESAASDVQCETLNSHVWVSPFEAARMTRYLGKHLAETDSLHAENYLSNANIYAVRLDSLGEQFRELVSKAKNRRLVTFHEAFEYFARDVGLELVAVVQLDPGIAPTAREVNDLISIIRDDQPVGIFTEPQYSAKIAELLSQETGVPLYTLDPAASGAEDPESYLRVMRSNFIVLRTALSVASE